MHSSSTRPGTSSPSRQRPGGSPSRSRNTATEDRPLEADKRSQAAHEPLLLNGLDPDKLTELVKLKRQVRDMDALPAVEVMQQAIAAAGGPKTTGQIALARELEDKHKEIRYKQLPTWLSLKKYDIERRTAGQQPHPMSSHLRQRLGDAQRGERPEVRTTGRDALGVAYKAVTKDNYRDVLDAADRVQWTGLSEADRGKLAELSRTWTPKTTHRWQRPKDSVLADRASQHDAAGHVIQEPLSEAHRKNLLEAWGRIRDSVDEEVLNGVGLPRVEILDPNNPELGDRPAFYDQKTKTMKFSADRVTVDRIMHEFGHHIEEQGPVEIWCALASYLASLSEGLPLDPARARETREPSYGFDWQPGKSPRVPNAGYAMTYYPDAATELLALALENDIPAILNEVVNWEPGAESKYDPEYVAIVLRAFRPQQLRELGVSFPTLL
jgi:hypothetical protein